MVTSDFYNGLLAKFDNSHMFIRVVLIGISVRLRQGYLTSLLCEFLL